MNRPDKLMTASWDAWMLTAATAPSQRARRLAPSWWTPAWALLVAMILTYSGYLSMTFLTISSVVFAQILPPLWTGLGWIAFLAALGGGLRWRRVSARRALERDAPVTALNDESWDTMTQVLARLGGYLAMEASPRGFWFLANEGSLRNTWSLQAPLPHGGHVEIDYLITPQERRLRVAAQGVPGQTLRDLEVVLPEEERGPDDPARLAEQVGRFLISAAPEALTAALGGAPALTLRADRGGALKAAEAPVAATLRPLRPPARALPPRRVWLYLLVAWRSYALATAPLWLGLLAAGLVALTQELAALTLNDVMIAALASSAWLTLGLSFWWALRPARPRLPPREARAWSAALRLEPERLSIAGQGEISLLAPFSLQLSRAPLGRGRALLVVEALQRGESGVRRLRMCAPVGEGRALTTLPELQTDAPLVDVRVLCEEIWPRLRAAAAMHGADPGWALQVEEAAEVASVLAPEEVSAVAV